MKEMEKKMKKAVDEFKKKLDKKAEAKDSK